MKIWMPLIATGTGAEVYADRLAEVLGARGHEVVLEKVAERFQYAPWLAGLRAPANADVVFANSWSARAFAGAAPLVTVVHHVAVDPAGDAFKSLAQKLFHRGFVTPMERAALRRSARIVAVSEMTARSIRAHLMDCSVEVVPPGVDTAFFTPGGEVSARDVGAPIRLLFVGKPSVRKGFDVVSDVVSRLGDRVELTCVGDPPASGMSRPPATYLGRVDDAELREAYRSSDALIFPSRLEGFGYVAAEALACGVPVICSEGTAVEETCGEGPQAITAPAGDAAAISERIVSAWEAEPGFQSRKTAARARAEAAFSLDRWAGRMERVLAEAAGL